MMKINKIYIERMGVVDTSRWRVSVLLFCSPSSSDGFDYGMRLVGLKLSNKLAMMMMAAPITNQSK